MIKQLIQYDKQKGILAFPVTMPLPKELMKYLYSCSGNLPTIFKNKYSLNPNYPMKLLFNGSLSENGQQIDYRDETYFMEEEMYLFTSVPNEVAEVVFKKLNLYPHYKTFFETIN